VSIDTRGDEDHYGLRYNNSTYTPLLQAGSRKGTERER
jgi:hypothetical protein